MFANYFQHKIGNRLTDSVLLHNLIYFFETPFVTILKYRLSEIGLRSCRNEVDLAKNAARQAGQTTTIFSKIIDGSIPAKIIYRDSQCLAFHDVNPQAPVHFLVIPIKPIQMLEKSVEDDKEVLGIYRKLMGNLITDCFCDL